MKKLFVTAALAVLMICTVGTSQARESRQKAASVAGVFDYYLLSLSWSPTFCLTHAGNEQCTGKGYGFVLHGLWPQYSKGGWPESCAPLTQLTAEQRAKGLTLFPTLKLLEHEWTKHGTCSGLGATAYLDASDKALGNVQIPAVLQPSTATRYFEAAEIEQLFRDANPGMADKGVAVLCSGPELSEVRVCLSKDLGFGACGKDVKTQCRAGQIRVPPLR